ncbi:hypothetical protein D3C80_959840 [compost metagenome]
MGPVLVNVHAHSCAQVIERRLYGVDILARHAFIQKAEGHRCQAGLMRCVGAASGKAHKDVKHRQAGRADEQDLRSAEGFVTLDRQRAVGRRSLWFIERLQHWFPGCRGFSGRGLCTQQHAGQDQSIDEAFELIHCFSPARFSRYSGAHASGKSLRPVEYPGV